MVQAHKRIHNLGGGSKDLMKNKVQRDKRAENTEKNIRDTIHLVTGFNKWVEY